MGIVRCLQSGLALAAWLWSVAAAALVIDAERLAQIDAHALAAPQEVEASPQQLAHYLVQPAHNDAEKARAIFRWIGDRITYDVNAYFNEKLEKVDAATVLRQHGAVCDGYATLFEALGKEVGLDVISIKGYAKAYGYFPGTVLDKPNHAWNAVKIDGQWRLIDSTWGAGYVRDGKYVKTVSEVFFLAAPEQLMFSHFPEEESWQLQATPHLTKPQFEALPTLEPAFFHTGISGERVWQALQTAAFKGTFVRTFDMPYRMVQVQQAPLAYHLGLNQPQNFCIQTGAFEKMSVLLNDQWTEMQKEGNVFTLDFTPAANGTLMVVGKKPDATNYTAILSYVVE